MPPVATPATGSVPSVLHFRSDQPARLAGLTEALTRLLSERGAPGRGIVACCIGTDRSTGDAFGPLVGQALARHWRAPGAVIGTVAEPLHALNMAERTAHLSGEQTPIVIAIDAALGALASVGSVALSDQGIRPGEGVGKDIPRLGEIAITGIVNVQAGALSAQVLQSTRLFLVQQLAELVSFALLGASRRLERARQLAAVA